MHSKYTISDFTPATEWVEKNGGEVFRNRTAYDWFKRKHRKELLASGELISRRGRIGDMVGPRFGQVCVEILLREQQEVA